MTHVAVCRQILGDIANDLRVHLARRKVASELQARCVYRWRDHAGSLLRPYPLRYSPLHTHDHFRWCFVHSLSRIRREREHSRSAGTRRLVHALLKTLHWPVVLRATADRVVQARVSIPSIKKTIQICLSDLIKVDVALKCNHATHDSFHSLGTVAYTCVKCGVRVDSTSKSYLFVQALDTAKFEYLLVTLRPKLLLHLERQNMALEDVQSFCRHHRVELETTAALLLQRAILLFLRRKHGRRAESRVLVSLNAHDRRRRQRQCARDLYRVQCRVRRKPIKLLQIVDGALSLGRSYDANDNVDLPAKISTPTPTTLRESIAASTPESVGRLPSNQATPSTAPLLPYSNLQTSTASHTATEVISSIVLPSIERSTPSPEFYRCFAPQCGGRKFLNKKWYVLHMEKHATTKKRLHDEAAFLDRMRNHGLPMLRQHTEAPPPVPQKPMSKQCLPSLGNHKSATMLMQLVRLDTVAAADAQVVRVTRDMAELVMGRSVKHCDIIIDCPAYPGLVSKQHLRLVISDSTTVVVEDLGSKNGTFVNGKQQHQRLELYAGDMLELGRVKHRPESGVVFVCHLPNCAMSQVSATRKLFVRQLLSARSLPESRNKYLYRGVELIRAWIQGIVVDVQMPRFAVDDGTGIMWIDMQGLIKANSSLSVQVGEYVMIIGPVLGTQGTPQHVAPDRIQAHQVIPLTAKDVHRELGTPTIEIDD
ncbi:hypothetical protein, variant [Aphanomyces invadans]|uniref:FHA domain-containing protein n=1 Tax=Aphanomyces invadans TaxID=157072 RepID=A0A024UGU8_9STRA|nr:hypothetical protein, variant [Aphanomyces invadans]ETW05656.1 hypothetical protein, variant [Aphanomyces invadans]|eukprot:XP_008865433.1 hypothetical protein, variant [Aphanomyces invadans]